MIIFTRNGMECAVKRRRTSFCLSAGNLAISASISCLKALTRPEFIDQRSMMLSLKLGVVFGRPIKYLAIALMLLPVVLQQYCAYCEKAITLLTLSL